jgi:hypothetical protein
MTPEEERSILVHIEYIREAITAIQARFVADDAECNQRHHESDAKLVALQSEVTTWRSWFKAAGAIIMALLTGIIAYLVKAR